MAFSSSSSTLPVRCFSQIANIRCQGLTDLQQIVAFVPAACLALILPAVLFGAYKYPRAPLFLLCIEITIHLATGGWDLEYFLHSPSITTVRSSDTALACTAATAILVYLLALTAHLLSDLRPHLPHRLRSRGGLITFAILLAPLIPLGYLGDLLGGFVNVEHRLQRGEVVLGFDGVYKEWVNVVLTNLGSAAALTYTFIIFLLSITLLTHPPSRFSASEAYRSLTAIYLTSIAIFITAIDLGLALIPPGALRPDASFVLILVRRLLLLLSRSLLGLGLIWGYKSHEAAKRRREGMIIDGSIRGTFQRLSVSGTREFYVEHSASRMRPEGVVREAAEMGQLPRGIVLHRTSTMPKGPSRMTDDLTPDHGNQGGGDTGRNTGSIYVPKAVSIGPSDLTRFPHPPSSSLSIFVTSAEELGAARRSPNSPARDLGHEGLPELLLDEKAARKACQNSSPLQVELPPYISNDAFFLNTLKASPSLGSNSHKPEICDDSHLCPTSPSSPQPPLLFRRLTTHCTGDVTIKDPAVSSARQTSIRRKPVTSQYGLIEVAQPQSPRKDGLDGNTSGLSNNPIQPDRTGTARRETDPSMALDPYIFSTPTLRQTALPSQIVETPASPVSSCAGTRSSRHRETLFYVTPQTSPCTSPDRDQYMMGSLESFRRPTTRISSFIKPHGGSSSQPDSQTHVEGVGLYGLYSAHSRSRTAPPQWERNCFTFPSPPSTIPNSSGKIHNRTHAAESGVMTSSARLRREMGPQADESDTVGLRVIQESDLSSGPDLLEASPDSTARNSDGPRSGFRSETSSGETGGVSYPLESGGPQDDLEVDVRYSYALSDIDNMNSAPAKAFGPSSYPISDGGKGIRNSPVSGRLGSTGAWWTLTADNRKLPAQVASDSMMEVWNTKA